MKAAILVAGLVLALIRLETVQISVQPDKRLRPVEMLEDGYVSSRVCRACHPSQYQSWYGSYHRTMTQVAEPATVRADFDGVHVTTIPGRPMVLERKGSEFWAEFDDQDWSGLEQPPRTKRQVVMITGSHHQQVYWYATGQGRLLGQLPAIYLVSERQWIPRNAAFLRPPTDRPFSETGRWNQVCIGCHVTHGKPKFDGTLPASAGMNTADSSVAEFGVACEACHAPSQAHVSANWNPLRRYRLHLSGRPDGTVIQPLRLDPRQSSEVCGQCHSVWTLYDTAAEQRRVREGLQYRPGAELAKTRFVAQPTQNVASETMTRILRSDPVFIRDSFWSDGMIRVSGREYNGLIESPCFTDATEANRTLSCSSCHTMHKPADDLRSIRQWADTHQLAAARTGNEACLQCHELYRKDITKHSRHEAGSTGSSCYNCHMPYTTYGLLKALRSHQISSPTVEASIQTGRPSACNLCHLNQTLEWTSTYLEQWYGIPKSALGPDERRIAASLLWLLKGDAGQRALVAWSMGWKPAQAASGTEWMAPYLSLTLTDPYAAVRFISYRSLRSLSGFDNFAFDLFATPERRVAGGMEAFQVWRAHQPAATPRPSAVPPFEIDGRPSSIVVRLLQQRDDGRVNLRE